jgi:hypothetical protein
MREKDLEAGEGVLPLRSENDHAKSPRRPRRPLRKDSITADIKQKDPQSPTTIAEEFIDPDALVASCGCKNSKKLELLPFLHPRDLRLTRPSKGSAQEPLAS